MARGAIGRRAWAATLAAFAVHWGSSAAGDEASPPREPFLGPIERDLFLRLDRGASLEEVFRAFPGDAQLLGGFDRAWVVRLPSPPSDAELERLSRADGVRTLLRERPLEPNQPALPRVDGTDCPPDPAAPLANRTFADLAAIVRGLAGSDEARCTYGERQVWYDALERGDRSQRREPGALPARLSRIAQESVDGPLMLQELDRLGVAAGHTRVAVFDSGFAAGAMKYASSPVETRAAYAGVGLPDQDDNDHGTPVVSLYVATDGIGLAPKAAVTSYRVTAPGQKNLHEGLTRAAIEGACAGGHRVINLSFSVAGRDLFPYERADPGFVESLAERGCVLVKSAGNVGDEIDPSVLDPDDPVLRVGAVDPETQKTPPRFPRGEVRAPGVGVLALSTGRGRPGTSFFDGSSLATPITGAILANVFGVLSKSDLFRRLPPREQARLAVRIVRASEIGGMVNGLRAVVIAGGWAAGGRPTSVEALARLAGRDPACRAPASSCRDEPNCGRQPSCATRNRRWLALCDGDATTVDDLVETYLRAGEFELASVVSRLAPGAEARQAEVRNATANQYARAAEIARRRALRTELARLEGNPYGSYPKEEFAEWGWLLREQERNYVKMAIDSEKSAAQGFWGWFGYRDAELSKRAEAMRDQAACSRAFAPWVERLGRDGGERVTVEQVGQTWERFRRSNHAAPCAKVNDGTFAFSGPTRIVYETQRHLGGKGAEDRAYRERQISEIKRELSRPLP